MTSHSSSQMGSALKIKDSHIMIPISEITNDSLIIKEKMENVLEELEEVDQRSSLGTSEAQNLSRIQEQVLDAYASLEIMTRRFLKLLGGDLGDVQQEEFINEQEESDEEDKNVTGDIQVVGTEENIEIVLGKIYDKYGMTASQRQILGANRKEMQERYKKLQEHMDFMKGQLSSVKEQHKNLCKQAGDVNKAPVYECKVTMTATVPKTADGICKAAGQFAQGIVRKGPNGKLCKKDFISIYGDCCQKQDGKTPCSKKK